MSGRSILDVAIELSAKLPVFPCRTDKKPACKRGFHAATRDVSNVAELWRESPGPLIGVPTGAVSGFDALDIDPRHSGDVWFQESIEALPITRTHITRSGGRHIMFQHSDGVKNTASKIAPGVDTRGDGGYIIYWPSFGCDVENKDVLAEWPLWLLRILLPPKRFRSPIAMPATRLEADSRAALMIERAFARVRHAAPGQRHYELRAAAATLGGLSRFITSSASDIERQLVDLIMSTGGECRRTAEQTAHWAMDKGASAPLLGGK